MSFVLQIPRRLYDEIVTQARSELPNECCGFLAGTVTPAPGKSVPVGTVTQRYPLVNAAASPVVYDADPKCLFLAFKDMRRAGTELLAIYHSHPTTEPVPSRTDLARNGYGAEVVHLIVSLKEGETVMRGWRLGETTFEEVSWEWV